MYTLMSAGLHAEEPGGGLQKTSGAAVRSVMDDLISENRFEALSSAPATSLQPKTGMRDTLHSSQKMFSMSTELSLQDLAAALVA